jgi:FixJ family two-component response regulator
VFNIDIVEDDSALLDALQTLFDSVGWSPRGYPTGTAFLEAPRREVDCLLIDTELPDMSGLEVLRAMNAVAFPTIGLTTRLDSAASKAMIGYVEKMIAQPVTASELIAEISELLAESPQPPTR